MSTCIFMKFYRCSISKLVFEDGASLNAAVKRAETVEWPYSAKPKVVKCLATSDEPNENLENVSTIPRMMYGIPTSYDVWNTYLVLCMVELSARTRKLWCLFSFLTCVILCNMLSALFGAGT